MDNWSTTQESLPGERESVQFILAGHRSPLYGTFTDHCFRSRWATYLAAEVRVWRKLREAPQDPAPSRTASGLRFGSDRPMRNA